MDGAWCSITFTVLQVHSMVWFHHCTPSNCRVTLLLIRQYSLKTLQVLCWMHLPALPFGRLDLIIAMVFLASFCWLPPVWIYYRFLTWLSFSFYAGTGHGVGAALNVHEGPQSISYRYGNMTPLQKGMIVSNEPGYYEDHAFGIRIEVQSLRTLHLLQEFWLFNFLHVHLAHINWTSWWLKVQSYIN